MSKSSEYLPTPKGFSTTAVHTSPPPKGWSPKCIVPPIVTTTIFVQDDPTKLQDYVYGRWENPTRDVLESSLAALENAKYAYCYSTGLAALSTIMCLHGHGYHIVSCDDLYAGNLNVFDDIGKEFGIELTKVDATTNPDNVRKAIRPNTKFIFIESPTNPLFKVIDIKAIAEIAKKNNIHLVVDNTFLTSYFQKPLSLGADIVTYSLTKYINGHTDVVMGAALTNNPEIGKKLKLFQKYMGAVPGPFDCYLVIRSLSTLSLRLQRHSSNSLAVAKFLESHPKVKKVLHPGLESHPQHELTKRQTSGHSGIMSMFIVGGLKESERFLRALKLFIIAPSLGGTESLAEMPAAMSHDGMTEEKKREHGITDNLIRLSIGLEEPEDLIEDLKQALKIM